MSHAEDAADRARAESREAGPPPPPGEEAAKFERDIAPGRPSYDVLYEWAQIHVPLDDVRSTRRFGAPLTFLKRGLLRFLRQYTREVEARQTRFNLAVLARLRELEDRRPE